MRREGRRQRGRRTSGLRRRLCARIRRCGRRLRDGPVRRGTRRGARHSGGRFGWFGRGCGRQCAARCLPGRGCTGSSTRPLGRRRRENGGSRGGGGRWRRSVSDGQGRGCTGGGGRRDVVAARRSDCSSTAMRLAARAHRAEPALLLLQRGERQRRTGEWHSGSRSRRLRSRRGVRRPRRRHFILSFLSHVVSSPRLPRWRRRLALRAPLRQRRNDIEDTERSGWRAVKLCARLPLWR